MNDELREEASRIRQDKCDQQSKDQLRLCPLRHRCGRWWRWLVPMQHVACNHLDSEFVPCCVWIGVWLRIGRSASVEL